MINSKATCIYCMKETIEYKIEKGSYTFYCHTCKKTLNKSDLLGTSQVESAILYSKKVKKLNELQINLSNNQKRIIKERDCL